MGIRALPALLLILLLPNYLEASEAGYISSPEADFIDIGAVTSDGWRQHSEDPPPHYSMFWLLADGWRQDAEHDRAWAVQATAERFHLSTNEAGIYLDAVIATSTKVRAAMDAAMYNILCPVHTAAPRGGEIGVALDSLDGVRWSVQNAHLGCFNAQHPAQQAVLIAELTEMASKGVSLSTNHTRRDPGELEQHLTLICENRP